MAHQQYSEETSGTAQFRDAQLFQLVHGVTPLVTEHGPVRVHQPVGGAQVTHVRHRTCPLSLARRPAVGQS